MKEEKSRIFSILTVKLDIYKRDSDSAMFTSRIRILSFNKRDPDPFFIQAGSRSFIFVSRICILCFRKQDPDPLFKQVGSGSPLFWQEESGSIVLTIRIRIRCIYNIDPEPSGMDPTQLPLMLPEELNQLLKLKHLQRRGGPKNIFF